MNRHKRITAGLVACLVVFFGMVHAKKPRIELKLTGGLGSMAGSDANTFLERYRDWLVNLAKPHALPQQGTFHPVRSGMDWQGELLLRLNRSFSLGISCGYMQVHRSEEQIATDEGEDRMVNRLKYNLGAVPLTFSLYYQLPFRGKLQLAVQGGIGYCFATWSQTQTTDYPNDYTTENVLNTHGGNVEVRSGLALTWSLSKRLALVLEGIGRYLKIQKFTGGMSLHHGLKGNLYPVITEPAIGTLYYSESSNGFPNLWPFETRPDTEGGKNFRQARADFSGFSLRAGLRISL